jgi:hypothetical protein
MIMWLHLQLLQYLIRGFYHFCLELSFTDALIEKVNFWLLYLVFFKNNIIIKIEWKYV